MIDSVDAKTITASPLEKWKRLPGRPWITWVRQSQMASSP